MLMAVIQDVVDHLRKLSDSMKDMKKIISEVKEKIDGTTKSQADSLKTSADVKTTVDALNRSLGKTSGEMGDLIRDVSKFPGEMRQGIDGVWRTFEEATQHAQEAVDRQSAVYKRLEEGRKKIHDKHVAVGEAIIALGVGMAATYVQMHLRLADDIRKSARGTLLGGQGQGVRTETLGGAKSAMIETGMDESEAIELSVAAHNAISAAGTAMDSANFNKFTAAVADSARVSGASGKEISEFNKSLMTTGHLSVGTAKEIDSMLGDAANKFGLHGQKAMKVVSEHMDQLVNIDAGDREKFISGLLTGAGMIEKSGVDFGKYTSSLNKTEGKEALKAAAMFAMMSGNSLEHVQERMLTSKNGTGKDKIDAQREIIGMAGKVSSGAGFDVNDYMKKKSAFDSGTMTDAKERERFASEQSKIEMSLKPLLEKVHMTLEDVTGGLRQNKETVMPTDKVSNTDLSKQVGDTMTSKEQGKSAAAYTILVSDAGEGAARSLMAMKCAADEVLGGFGGVTGAARTLAETLVALKIVEGVSVAGKIGGMLTAVAEGLGTAVAAVGGVVAIAGVAAAALTGGLIGHLIGNISLGTNAKGEKRIVSDLFGFWAKGGVPEVSDRLKGDAASKKSTLTKRHDFTSKLAQDGIIVEGPNKNVNASPDEIMKHVDAGDTDWFEKEASKKSVPVQVQTKAPDTTTIERVSPTTASAKSAEAAPVDHSVSFAQMIKLQSELVALMDQMRTERLAV